MKQNKKQIEFDFDINPNLLSGKIIDKIAYCTDKNILITFKDNTFICLGLDLNMNEDYCIHSQLVIDPSWVESGCVLDKSGDIKFKNKLDKILLDLGIWETTDEEIKEIIKLKEEKEYIEYLRLKAKYENTN